MSPSCGGAGSDRGCGTRAELGYLVGVRPLARLTLVLIVASAGCQPLCGLVFDVALPPGVDGSTLALVVEATATNDRGQRVEPDRLSIAHTARGFVVEVAYFEPGVDVAVRVWVDLDGDGERGPGDLVAEVPRMGLDGAGCDGMTTLDAAIVLAAVPNPEP